MNGSSRSSYRSPRRRRSGRREDRTIVHIRVYGPGEGQPAYPGLDLQPIGDASYSVRKLVMGVDMITHTGLTGNFIPVNSVAEVQGALAHAILDIGGDLTAFKSLFDVYKIEEVELRIQSCQPHAPPLTGGDFPLLYVMVDTDDDSAVSVAELREANNVTALRMQDSLVLKYRPHITPATYAAASAAYTGYATVPSRDMWLDLGSDSIYNYGIKFGLEPSGSAASADVQWRVEAYYTLSFKRSR